MMVRRAVREGERTNRPQISRSAAKGLAEVMNSTLGGQKRDITQGTDDLTPEQHI